MFLGIIHRNGFLRQRVVERFVELDASLLQTAQILHFIVGELILPASPQDAHPFEGHHANRRVGAFAVLDLRLIQDQSAGLGAKVSPDAFKRMGQVIRLPNPA